MIIEICGIFYETIRATGCQKCSFFKKDKCDLLPVCRDKFGWCLIWIPIKKSTLKRIAKYSKKESK